MYKSKIATSLLMATFCASTMANNGTDTITFEEPRRFFVSCLAEYLSGTLYVTAKGHFFETPSGNVHIVDNWHYTLEVTGESTGRSWVTRNATSPFTGNISKDGEVFGFTDMAKLFPLDEGPMWIYNVNVKVRIDESGNVISESFKFATDDHFRCLGPDA